MIVGYCVMASVFVGLIECVGGMLMMSVVLCVVSVCDSV